MVCILAIKKTFTKDPGIRYKIDQTITNKYIFAVFALNDSSLF